MRAGDDGIDYPAVEFDFVVCHLELGCPGAAVDTNKSI